MSDKWEEVLDERDALEAALATARRELEEARAEHVVMVGEVARLRLRCGRLSDAERDRDEARASHEAYRKTAVEQVTFARYERDAALAVLRDLLPLMPEPYPGGRGRGCVHGYDPDDIIDEPCPFGPECADAKAGAVLDRARALLDGLRSGLHGGAQPQTPANSAPPSPESSPEAKPHRCGPECQGEDHASFRPPHGEGG